MMTGAAAVIKGLEQQGVQVVFGYPGAAVCPLYACLAASRKIRHVLVRQEQNAGHAASGYARISGQPGVCLATSGPGATNLITALATAYMDSIPLVAITGQVATELLGRDVFQEADITGAAESFVKHSYLVKEAAALPGILKEAFYLAGSGRPGPVLIDIPVDVLEAEFDYVAPGPVRLRGYNPTTTGNPLQIRKVAAAIGAARRPVICAGGGVFAAGARQALADFAARCQIPVVTTMMGLGLLPAGDPLGFGMLGIRGDGLANYCMHHADLIIIIGARAADRAFADPGVLERRTGIIHIDIDPAEIRKNLDTGIPLVGDARLVLDELAGVVSPPETGPWLAELAHRRPAMVEPLPRADGLDPRRVIRRITEALPAESVLISDVGQCLVWAAREARIGAGGRFLTSGGMGTMGYALPAAIGARLADPGRPVTAVMGDGAFQMSMMELAVLAQEALPVRLVVFVNETLGMIRQMQAEAPGGRPFGVGLGPLPDPAAIAAAYGIGARTIRLDDEVDAAVEWLAGSEGPAMLCCRIAADEPAP